MRLVRRAVLIPALAIAAPAFAQSSYFVPGNLVVAVEGAGVWNPDPATAALYPFSTATTTSAKANVASPMTLMQFSHTGTSSAAYVNATVLPQTASGSNHIVSAEFGSSSEAFLHLSNDGHYLLIAGYDVNASAFNANPTAYGTAVNNSKKPTALGQSGSLTADRQTAGKTYTPVARSIATIDQNGAVDSSTALYNVFNGNNPRSVASVDGSSFYVSGQGIDTDTTGGVFLASKGASAATAITGPDSTPNGSNVYTTGQDTRDLQVYKNQLYVSVDSKAGSNAARDFVGTLTGSNGLPTGIANNGQGPKELTGYGFGNPGKLDQGMQVISAATTNGINAAGQTINLSPEGYFFASDTVLYVADSGAPKNDAATGSTITNGSKLGDGGLQKWVLDTNTGIWSLQYTLSTGLNLVANTASIGSTGLFGLTGVVNGDGVELYATNYTITGLEQTYLYGITDSLSATTKNTGLSFTQLVAAPVGSIFKGVSFAPTAQVPEPASWALMVLGFGMIGGAVRRRQVRFA